MFRKLSVYVLLWLSIFATDYLLAKEPPRVLMVVSGHGKDQGKTRPGFEFDEFAKAYRVFKRHGLAVDVSSPAGGEVVADEYDPSKPYNRAVLSDAGIMDKLARTLPSKVLDPRRYSAVFVVGGKGAMFDLPNDPHLQLAIASVYEAQGVVAAVCHGPAALVNIVLSDKRPLVKGKRVNGFTNQEEKLFGQKWIEEFDFLLEDKLKQQGGLFESAPMMLSHVSVDGRLITGQNPFSTTATAQKLIQSLGLKLIAAEPDIEEFTIALIARLLDNDNAAMKAFNASPDSYKAPLIGMYGYFYLQQANSAEQIRGAVRLLALVAPTMEHEKIQVALASGYEKLGELDKASQVLKAFLQKRPEAENAKLLLAKLEG